MLAWLQRVLLGRRVSPLAAVAPGEACLIVGLGNPGPVYAGTRHNLGFECADHLAARLGAAWAADDGALVALTNASRSRLVLAKPQRFMNRSGPVVAGLVTRLAIEPHSVLIVYDDMDLPFGALRLRARGSAGTHNGMRSVVRALGTEEIARLRIGIGQAGPGAATDHVLSRFGPDEALRVAELVERAGDAALAWAKEGAEVAMNRYNRS